MDTINEIDVLEIKARFNSDDSLSIIDVRELDELKICKIDGAIQSSLMIPPY